MYTESISETRIITRLMIARHGRNAMREGRGDDFMARWDDAKKTVTMRTKQRKILNSGDFSAFYQSQDMATSLWSRMCDFWPTSSEWLSLIRRGLTPTAPSWIKESHDSFKDWKRRHWVRPWILMTGRTRRYLP